MGGWAAGAWSGMSWIPPAEVKCPRCGSTVRTRKPLGTPVNCNRCRVVFPHGGSNSSSSERTAASCARCAHVTKTSKSSGSVYHCSKCYTPNVVP